MVNLAKGQRDGKAGSQMACQRVVAREIPMLRKNTPGLFASDARGLAKADIERVEGRSRWTESSGGIARIKRSDARAGGG